MLFKKFVSVAIFCFFLLGRFTHFQEQTLLESFFLQQNNKYTFVNCSICGLKFQKGESYYKNYWGDLYHPQHANELNSCYSCSRLIHPNTCSNLPHEKGGYQYLDNRFICNQCINSGEIVMLPNHGEQILKETLKEAKKLGVDIPNIFNLKLVSEKELSEIRKQELREGEQNPALTFLQISKKILYDYSVKMDTKCDVFVLKGLHESYFKMCLAHELMHVWIFVNAQYPPEPTFCEGLCNYLAYETLMMHPSTSYNKFYRHNMKNNPDPVYGEGFRRVNKLADKLGGWENLLVYAKYNKKLPK